MHRELRTWYWREASRCLQTLEEHLPMRRSKRLKVTNIHFLCFPQAIKLKGIALVHLSPTPGTIFLPSSLLSCLPLSISLLRLMRMLSTGSPVSPLSFFFFFVQTPWLKFASFQNAAKRWKAVCRTRGKGDGPTEPAERSLVDVSFRKGETN